MAEDYIEKTEDPTPKKLLEARNKGVVAKSQDLTISILLIFSLGILFLFSGFMYRQIASMSLGIFSNLNFDYSDPSLIIYWMRHGLFQLFWTLLPLLSGVVLFAVLANVLQIGFLFSTFPLIPKWSRINFFNARNYRQNLSSAALVKLGFGILRLALLFLLSLFMISHNIFQIFNLSKGTPEDIFLFIFKEAFLIGMASALLYLALGICDYLYQKMKYLREMRMTRREFKDEIKQEGGNSKVKDKINAIMQSLAKPDTNKLISQAQVVLTDKDRFAIALAYDPSTMASPVCLLKGFNIKAIEMKELALYHKIPVAENSLLTRKLYKSVEAYSGIPKEFYYSVAAEMASVQEVRNNRPIN